MRARLRVDPVLASFWVPDVDCTAHHPGDTWVYYRAGQAVPALGGPTAAASGEPPAGDALPGVPDDGGTAGK